MVGERETTSNPYYNREKAQAAVIATNAIITEEQFEKLKQSIGQRLVLVYKVKEQYSDDDSQDQTYIDRTPFTLTDFNFVIDPQTRKRFLAYLRSSEGNTFYPACQYLSYFEDVRWVTVESILESDSEEAIWSFDHLGRYMRIDQREAGDYVAAIRDLTLSFVKSKTNRND